MVLQQLWIANATVPAAQCFGIECGWVWQVGET